MWFLGCDWNDRENRQKQLQKQKQVSPLRMTVELSCCGRDDDFVAEVGGQATAIANTGVHPPPRMMRRTSNDKSTCKSNYN